MPSSAQWMSSTAKISGWRAAGRLDQRAHGGEQALAHLLRVLGLAAVGPEPPGGSIPSGRPSAAASRSGRLLGLACDQVLDPAMELAPGDSASSVSTISNVPRTISASAQ